MTAREMHYDFKQKLNKIDSQKYRNLRVPEIDWKLNEACELFIKIIAEPRLASQLGLEINQRTIDDIRTVVVNQKPVDGIIPTVFDTSSFIAALPEDYMFYVNSKVLATKSNCVDVKLSTRPVQHDDEAELSPFDRSSFEWRISNIRFISEGLRIFTDGTYNINKIMYEYIKLPRLIHNAQDFENGTYKLNGISLTGSQSCELPVQTHREVVDLAVFITAGDLELPSYQIKQNKLKITS